MKTNIDDPEDCLSIVVIDTSRIPAKDLPDWIEENSRYFASPAIGTRQDVNVGLIPINEAQSWLQQNQLFIVFDVTYQYIECVHLISDEAEIEIVNRAPVVETMSFSALIEEIHALGGNFTFPNYNGYLRLSQGENDALVLSFDAEYCESNCFSIPMFHSLLYINGLDVDTIITFKHPEFGRFADKKFTLSIEVSPQVIKSYDFSQVPL